MGPFDKLWITLGINSSDPALVAKTLYSIQGRYSFLIKFKSIKSIVYAQFSDMAIKVGLQVMRCIPEGYMGTNFNSLRKYRAYAQIANTDVCSVFARNLDPLTHE